MLLPLIPLLLVIIGQAKTNKKAGRPGWHVIIPFLSQYTRAAIGDNIKNFWILLATLGISSVLGVLGTVLSEALGETIALIIALTSLPFGVAAIVFAIKIENGVARAFGKGKGFTAGLIFLPFIFNPILGFGKAEYDGEIPEKPVKTPKEPKVKKEKTPRPAKTPKTKKEKPAKGKQTPVVHPEPEEEVEPPRPEFKPQYDMGDTEPEEAPATPRMTMDQMMLQSLKAKKAPPPPVEEKAPVIEEKRPEKPSNRFSITVDYVPEAPKMDVPKADYLIPAFARPDYKPTPPAYNITPPVQPPVVDTPEEPAVEPPVYEQAQESVEEQFVPQVSVPDVKNAVDPFAFFGLEDVQPVPPTPQFISTPAPEEYPVEGEPAVPAQQDAPPTKQDSTPPIIEPVVQTPMPEVEEFEPQEEVKPMQQESFFDAPVEPQTVETAPSLFQAPVASEPIPLQGASLDIPGFVTEQKTEHAGPAYRPSYDYETQPVNITPTATASSQEPVVEIPTPTVEPPREEVVEVPVQQKDVPVTPSAPQEPPRFVDPKPVAQQPEVDDDNEELPPPPVVPLPPKRGFFGRRKSTAIDRFHNEDGGLK